MTVEQFLNTIQTHQKQLNQLMNRTLPIKGGALAKAHFQENFIKGGLLFIKSKIHPESVRD